MYYLKGVLCKSCKSCMVSPPPKTTETRRSLGKTSFQVETDKQKYRNKEEMSTCRKTSLLWKDGEKNKKTSLDLLYKQNVGVVLLFFVSTIVSKYGNLRVCIPLCLVSVYLLQVEPYLKSNSCRNFLFLVITKGRVSVNHHFK